MSGNARVSGMILTRRVHRRQAAVGAYYPDAFSIRIESAPPLINPTTLAMRTDDAEDFSTFVHEYWHYIQNLTTVAGFSSFELFHDLAARFHETLVNNGDGTSVGSAGILGTHGQAVQELLEIMDEACPAGIDEQEVDAFTIVDVAIDEYALSRNGHQVPLGRVRLTMKVQLNDGTETDAGMLFGQLCIEEGIAYEIDRMVAGGGPGTPAADNAPPFPYLVLRQLACAHSDVDVHRIDLIALATLALLTTDPAVNILDMLDDFGARRTAGDTAVQTPRYWRVRAALPQHSFQPTIPPLKRRWHS